jgi:hypothetical protein
MLRSENQLNKHDNCKTLQDCHVDGYGSWGNANGSFHLFNVNKDERNVTRLDRGRNIDERRKSITDFDFKVRHYYMIY